MKRRDFLKYNSLAIPSLSGMGIHTLAQSPFFRAVYNEQVETDKVLVIINLSGGNDGLGTVVPLDIYSQLTQARPEVIIPENRLLKIEDEVALHPSMTAISNLYKEGNVGIIQGVGYPNQNYSHFRSTDIWMTGSAAEEVLYTGWVGRYLNMEYPNFPIDYPNEIMPDPLGIQIGYDLSVAFQGPASSMGMVVADPNWFYDLVNDELQPSPDTKAGKKLDFVRLITKQSQVYGKVITQVAQKAPSQSPYPDTSLANQLKIVAQLVSGGLRTRIYMVNLDGFDTHDNQVMASDHTQGEHANLLGELSGAVDAFIKDIRGLGISERILMMTVSEFGRRITSNASNGTDHGSSAPLFLFGDNIQPGILGTNPSIPANPTWEDNLAMQFDFRSIYYNILRDWFCVDENDLKILFSNTFQNLPIVKHSPCLATSTREIYRQAGKSLVDIYPNPFQYQTKVTFRCNEYPVLVQLFNASGQLIQVLAQGKYAPGKHTVDLNAESLPTGNYFIRFQNQYVQQGKWAVKVH